MGQRNSKREMGTRERETRIVEQGMGVGYNDWVWVREGP